MESVLSEKKSFSESAHEQHLADPCSKDYFELYDTFLFFKKWWVLILLLASAGLGAGIVMSSYVPTYYESSLGLQIDQPKVHAITDPKEIRHNLTEIFTQRHRAEAFAASFLTTLRDGQGGGLTQGDLNIRQTDAYRYILAEITGLAGGTAEPSYELAMKRFTTYLMTTMLTYLKDEALIPARGFLFYLGSQDSNWQLRLRTAEEGLVGPIAAATLTAFNTTIDLYNEDYAREAQARKERELAKLGALSQKMTAAEVALGLIEKKRFEAKLGIAALGTHLSAKAGKSADSGTQVVDELARTLLSARLLAPSTTDISKQFSEFSDFVAEQKIVSHLNLLNERGVLARGELEEIVNRFTTYRLDAEAANTKRQALFADVQRHKAEYDTGLREITERYASQAKVLGGAILTQEHLVDASMLGKLDVKHSLALKLWVGGGVLGFLIACFLAVVRQSGLRRSAIR